MSTASTFVTRMSSAMPRRAARSIVIVAACTAVLGGGTYLAKGTGLRSMLFGKTSKVIAKGDRATFIFTLPADASMDVPVDTAITTRIRAPRELDRSTLGSTGVQLVRVGDQIAVPVDSKLTDPQTITVTPRKPLQARTQYALYIGHALRTTDGPMVRDQISTFTTAGPADGDLQFTKTPLPTTAGNCYTCVTVGPDGTLWASSVDGRVFRFPIAADGTLGKPSVNAALPRAEHGPRLLTGFAFDPAAPSDAPVLILSHSEFGFENVKDFTGKISRLSGPGLARLEDLVINLPRSANDHATNQGNFGPDGAYYFSQPSNSATGAADPFWANRPEHRLSACILRLDLSRLPTALPLDARTPDAGGGYDPDAPGAPLTIYATGVRLAFDVLWNSSGKLLTPVNGASAGGNTPADPQQPGSGLFDLATAENDWLLDVRHNAYYGHPNPVAGHFVLNGGRTAAQFAFGQVPEYPLGIKPDSAYRQPILCLGQHQSCDGLIEYRGPACSGKLDHRVLICRYARGGDVLVVTLNENGRVTDQQFGLPGLSGFDHPLDIAQNRATGDLYVSEFGAKCITLVRPK